MDLKVDYDRWNNQDSIGQTGIFVRALIPGDIWYSADIALLDKSSLLKWLQTGGSNPMAENVVGVLLGHGHLHEE